MAYTDILSLAQAKIYLRVDDSNTADDADITAMLNAAFEYIEDYTGHIMESGNRTYVLVDAKARVYDTPITALVSPATAVATAKSLYTAYQNTDPTETVLTLTVGYASAADIPKPLLIAVREIIAAWYYDQDANDTQDSPKGLLSQKTISILNRYKRFII